jgi:hypothetical protein
LQGGAAGVGKLCCTAREVVWPCKALRQIRHLIPLNEVRVPLIEDPQINTAYCPNNN